MPRKVSASRCCLAHLSEGPPVFYSVREDDGGPVEYFYESVGRVVSVEIKVFKSVADTLKDPQTSSKSRLVNKTHHPKGPK